MNNDIYFIQPSNFIRLNTSNEDIDEKIVYMSIIKPLENDYNLLNNYNILTNCLKDYNHFEPSNFYRQNISKEMFLNNFKYIYNNINILRVNNLPKEICQSTIYYIENCQNIENDFFFENEILDKVKICCYRRIGDNEKVLAILNKILQFRLHLKCLILKIEILIELKDYIGINNILSICNEYINNHPNRIEIVYCRGLCFLFLDSYENALKDFDICYIKNFNIYNVRNIIRYCIEKINIINERKLCGFFYENMKNSEKEWYYFTQFLLDGKTIF